MGAQCGKQISSMAQWQMTPKGGSRSRVHLNHLSTYKISTDRICNHVVPRRSSTSSRPRTNSHSSSSSSSSSKQFMQHTTLPNMSCQRQNQRARPLMRGVKTLRQSEISKRGIRWRNSDVSQTTRVTGSDLGV